MASSDTELILKGHWGHTDHCQCGLPSGCPDCYGKINCGCQDCYQPQTRTFKIRKAKSLALRFDKTKQLEPFSPEFACAEISHEVSAAVARVGEHQVCVEEGVVRRSHQRETLGYNRRPLTFMETLQTNRFHRLSVPELPSRPQPGQAKSRERRREELEERSVGPPRQTRYFCKTCNADVCNACFSSRCGTHNVQFLGAAYFHCKSPFHRIQHDSKPKDQA